MPNDKLLMKWATMIGANRCRRWAMIPAPSTQRKKPKTKHQDFKNSHQYFSTIILLAAVETLQ
jgi:hypothetical protein